MKTENATESITVPRLTDVYQIITDRIVAKLEQGCAPWNQPWKRDAAGNVALPANLVSKKPYRGVNVFLLGASGYASQWWLSYKQAQELGGNVRKGEKGTPCIFWKVEKREGKDEDGKERKTRLILRYYTVFNLEQCEGIAAPASDAPAAESVKFDPIAAAAAIAAGMKNPPALRHNEARAYYRPSTDSVNMPKPELFASPAEYYSVLFHELTHATSHSSRLNRELNGLAAFGSAAYGREELVAEMGAAFLSGHAGILHHTVDNSAAYLENWIKAIKGEPRMVVIAAAQAQKAADYILNQAPASEENDGAKGGAL